MPYYKFEKDDVFFNRIKTYPKVNFKIVRAGEGLETKVYYNNRPEQPGQFSTSKSTDSGHVSLYEMNVDKLTGSNNLIHPFVTKGGSMHAFSTVSSTGFHGMEYGDTLTGSYPLTSSIHRMYYAENDDRKHIFALKSNLNRMSQGSRHFAFTGSQRQATKTWRGIEYVVNETWDKSTQEINMISVPSIFYGSEIQKGTISLKYYITGTLAAEVSDVKRNGELIQIGPSGSLHSGSVAGVVLYEAGIFLLTGSWDIDSIERDYLGFGSGDLRKSKWIHFGSGIQGNQIVGNVTASSYDISFRGTNYIPTVTMLAHAPVNRLNHSNNPTYLEHPSATGDGDGTTKFPTITGSTVYKEYPKREINNVVASDFAAVTGSYKKTTFISTIEIYDDEMNVIGIAKVAKPVKKTPERSFTFKLKLDF